MECFLNISTFLKIIYSSKKSLYPRDAFLDDLLVDLILKNKLKNNKGERYVLSPEITSRLYNGRINVPQQLKNVISHSTMTNDEYISNSISAFNKAIGESQIEYVCSIIYKLVESSINLNQKHVFQCKVFLDSKKYYSFLWYSFCLSMISANNINNPIKRKKESHKTNLKVESFFYLSVSEQKEKCDTLISYLINQSNHLKIVDLKMLLEAIHYCNIFLESSKKAIVIKNFLKNWEFDERFPDNLSMKMYFEDAIYTFGDKDKYLSWYRLIDHQFELIECAKIKAWFNKLNKDTDYSKMNHEFITKYLRFDIYKSSNLVLKCFKNNNYLLPNYKGTISKELWSYCHNISIFCAKTPLFESFMSYLNNIKKSNCDDVQFGSRTDALIERCNKERVKYLLIHI